MSEIIYVTYSTASAASKYGPTFGYHKILNYIDKSGVHRVIDGGPF